MYPGKETLLYHYVLNTFYLNTFSYLLAQGNVGPFQPPLPVEVPVWLSLIMKKNNKCTIVCPDWLTVGKVALCEVMNSNSPTHKHTHT